MGSFRALAINKKLPAADKTTFGVKCEQFLMVGCSSITLSADLVLLWPKAGKGPRWDRDRLPGYLVPAPIYRNSAGRARAVTQDSTRNKFNPRHIFSLAACKKI